MSAGVLERITGGFAQVGQLRDRGRPRTTGTPVATERHRPGRDWWLLVALVLVAEATVVVDLGVPVLRPLLGLGVLLALPTWLVAPTLGWLPERHRVLTALGVVVLGTLLGAGLLNVVLPYVGVDAPLRAPFLALASTAVNLGLLRARSRQAEGWLVALRHVGRQARTVRARAALVLASLGLVLAILGAVRLNNGAGGAVTMVALACVSLALLALMVERDTSPAADGATIYVVGVALLLATSLRGWFVEGHDVQLEFVSYLLTESEGRWAISQYPTPYHACLSINIWPVVVSAFSGVSGAYVFKLVLQLLYALIPVQAYLWFRELLPRPMAVLSAILIVAFPTFTTDLPYLVRQEGAFYFLTLALLVARPRAGGTRAELWRTRALAGLFLVGVMFSHYSTTYTVLMVLGVGCALLHAERFVLGRRGHFVERRPLVLLWWPLIAGLALATWVWVNPVTGTGGHAGDVFKNAIASIMGDGEDREASSDLSYVPFLGDGPTPQERLDDYSAQVQQMVVDNGATDQVLGLTEPDAVEPRIEQPEGAELTGLGQTISRFGIDVAGGNAALRTVLALLLQVGVLVGAWVVVRGGRRLTMAYSREQVWLTVGCVGALGAFAVVPGLSVDYGVLRVFYQGLLIFAPVVVLGFITLAQRLGRYRTPVVAGVIVATLATLGGFVPALTGGDTRPRPAFSQVGPYQQLYSLSPQEVAGARWLRSVGAPFDGAPVPASPAEAAARDSTSAAVRKNAMNLYPGLILRDQYLYLGRSVVQQQRSAVFYSGDLLFYRYPLQQVEARMDTVYSNPTSVVLR